MLATRVPAPGSVMRKTPRQARSKATIEVLLQAAARILGQRGWAGLTTNAVAEAAGVSIGSLYQYFPNKLALVEAVRLRHFDELLALLRAGTDPSRPRGERIVAFCDGMIAIHDRHPAAHQALLEDAPRGAASRAMHQQIDAGYRKCFGSLISASRPRHSAQHLVVVQVLSAAVAAVVHDAARKGTLAAPEFRRELIALVDSYLSGQP
jgi:AcrR family transcriptional regulator